jgi:hypothetical protein
MTQTNDISTYSQFWPYYLREHAKPLTRAIHFLGTALAVITLGAATILGSGWLLLAALAIGYGPAWYAHFFIERNRPATFPFPLWSLISDFRMTGLWLSGRLSKELELAGVRSPSSSPGQTDT